MHPAPNNLRKPSSEHHLATQTLHHNVSCVLPSLSTRKLPWALTGNILATKAQKGV